MPFQGNCFTNHPGVVDFKGHSYFFYHNQALPGGGSYHRSVCLEEFTYNEDGTFPEINMMVTELGMQRAGWLQYRTRENHFIERRNHLTLAEFTQITAAFA